MTKAFRLAYSFARVELGKSVLGAFISAVRCWKFWYDMAKHSHISTGLEKSIENSVLYIENTDNTDGMDDIEFETLIIKELAE